VDDFWQISGKLGGKLGDIHSSPGSERKTKTLVGEGFSSLAILPVPGLRSLPKLDVAGSTPVARSTLSSIRSATSEDSRGGFGALTTLADCHTVATGIGGALAKSRANRIVSR